MTKLHVMLVEPPGERGYLPLAAAYLVAYASKDPDISQTFEFAFEFSDVYRPFVDVLSAIVRRGAPDVVCFSCQGWALPRADQLAAELRKRYPGMTIVYGGNHVSHQAPAFLEERPFADVLVNGEGEQTFHELLRHLMLTGSVNTLDGVPGLSFRAGTGEIRTTADRPRIEDLSSIPSPYLTGVLKPTPESCSTALLETNRGCPYSCSFCYWGEAIGQKLHMFDRARLEAEMRLLAGRKIDSWFICDANFGIRPQDAEVVEYIVALRKRYGYPKTVHTNWAKNSNRRIVEMCARLNEGGVHSTYTLALQSTTEDALVLANRKNMKINRIDEIARLCREHDVIPRGELIWGLPGESYDDFLSSYDDLAEHTDALSVYPLYVLPNTKYGTNQLHYAIRTERGEADTAYLYCVEHSRMTRDEFLTGLRFIVSNNILRVGSTFFKVYPRVANLAGGIPYHQSIGALSRWIVQSEHPVAARFKKFYRFPLTSHRQSLGATWQAIRDDRDGFVDMLRAYTDEELHPSVDEAVRDVLREAFEFDAVTFPVMDDAEREGRVRSAFYVAAREFNYDFLTVKRGGEWRPRRYRVRYTVRSPKGLWRYPVSNWYFGLLSYRGVVETASGSSS